MSNTSDKTEAYSLPPLSTTDRATVEQLRRGLKQEIDGLKQEIGAIRTQLWGKEQQLGALNKCLGKDRGEGPS